MRKISLTRRKKKKRKKKSYDPEENYSMLQELRILILWITNLSSMNGAADMQKTAISWCHSLSAPRHTNESYITSAVD